MSGNSDYWGLPDDERPATAQGCGAGGRRDDYGRGEAEAMIAASSRAVAKGD